MTAAIRRKPPIPARKVALAVLLAAAVLFALSGVALAEAPRQRVLDPCADPANPVVAENCQPGSDSWIVAETGSIQGFAYPPTVNKGGAISFYVTAAAPAFDIQIYRSGYYGGLGGRLVETVPDVPGGEQPPCQQDLYNTGLTSCSNWAPSYTMEVPPDWVSGIYVAKLIRADDGGENYLLFVVRDDDRDSDILYQQSIFTYQAYNNRGGKSIYNVSSGVCLTDTNNPRASHVSLFRPYRGGMDLGSNFQNNYFRAEYPMVRWLEQQGYDVTYSTNLDTHHSGLPGAHNELLDHRVFLSVGHDEYWTQEIDDAITAARDAGVHLGIFSANTSYWRVRLEPDPWTGEPDSVIVAYKTTEDGPPDPSGHPTGTFRDPEGVNDPENGLVGVMYIGDNDDFYFPLRIDAEYSADPIYRHTDLQSMAPGTYITLGEEIFGWEWDATVDNGRTPDGLTILAETPVYGLLLRDAGNSNNATSGPALAQTTRYTAPGGAIVFASGTIQWSWGLGAQGVNLYPVDLYIQQMTYNILADMGVAPGSPSVDLILDGEDGLITSPPDLFLPADAPGPAITSVTVDADQGLLRSGREVEFSWETDRPAYGQLWIGPAPGEANTPDDALYDLETSHTTSILIRPGVTYFYRIMAVDEQYRVTATELASFEAPPNLIWSLLFWGQDTADSISCAVQKYPVLGPAAGVLALIVLAGAAWLGIGVFRRRRARNRTAGA